MYGLFFVAEDVHIFAFWIETGHAAAGDAVIGTAGDIDTLVGTDSVFERAVHILPELAKIARVGGGGDALGFRLWIPRFLRVVDSPVAVTITAHIDFVVVADDVVDFTAVPADAA